MSTATATVELIPLRWWHLEDVLQMERELFGDEAWSVEMFWSELAGAETYYLLAEDADRRALGYGGLALAGPESFIQTVGVTGAAQGRGLGRRLMDALLDEAVRRGATSCWLEVRTDNAPAQQLYRTLGFEDRGVRRGYYQPSGADALIMELDLRGGVR
jgi:[ribosomal protein S18]-alanine N-acetyltransferase